MKIEWPDEHGSEHNDERELVFFLIEHINNPCEVEVGEAQRANLRDFYLREAERVLPTINDLTARELLKAKINEYREKEG